MHECMYVYACILSLYCCITTHIFNNDNDIVNMSHTAFMLNKDIDTTFLHIYNTTQLTVISTLHIIVMCVLTTNMPLKCQIYVTYAN